MHNLALSLARFALFCALLFTPVAAGPAPRIAIVNHVNFHLEVLGGVLHLLKDFPNVHVYLHSKVLKENMFGFWDWNGRNPGMDFRDFADYKGDGYDFIWLISPEWRVGEIKKMVAAARPQLVVAYVHNGNSQQLEDVAGIHPSTELLALSAHVADYINQRAPKKQRRADWLLPIKPFAPPKPCTPAQPDCLRGFVVQGRVESTRRNYTHMLEQIVTKSRRVDDPNILRKFQLDIIGQKVPGERWKLPAHLQRYVQLHHNTPYLEFYGIIGRSYSLVPMLASPLYYKCKFSSTVLTSLMTGTPMIAGEKILSKYTMLTRDAVFFQSEKEQEVDAMFNILSVNSGGIWDKRRAVEAAREQINARSADMIKGWLDKVAQGSVE